MPEPGSRLNQALTVARQILDQPLPPWMPSHLMGIGVPGADLDAGDGEDPPPAPEFGEQERAERGRPTGADSRVRPSAGYSQRSVAPAEQPPAAHRAQYLEPEDLVIDLRPKPEPSGPTPRRSAQEDYGLGRNWGSTWRWAAQGWIGRETAQPVWRPVVTTTADLSDWDVDTYLGMVTGEAAVEHAPDPATLGAALAEGRSVAIEGMVDTAVTRGAHAIVGTRVSYTSLGNRVLVSITGTAVTLRDR